jgi:cyclopropane fatty-acyl-phospholipid synthase-like methyltransferase
VAKDFELYKKLVKTGGIIALHDIAHHSSNLSNCEVDCFWQKIKNRYKTREIIEDVSQGWAGIGLIYV